MKTIHNGVNTFLWFERWHNGILLKDYWPTLFSDCADPWITIRHFHQLLNNPESLFLSIPAESLSALIDINPECSHNQDDILSWALEKSGNFSVKSFYKFLIDGGLRSPLYSNFWKIRCPSKVTLFCWLAGEEKILTLTNLFKKGFNFQNSTNTCVLCHNASENLQHLFLDCAFTNRIWAFFLQVLDSNSLPQSIPSLWSKWITNLNPQLRILLDLISRAVTWNIWIQRNTRIFQFNALPHFSIIFKVANVLLSWFSTAADRHQHSLNEASQKIKRSLNFLSARESDPACDPAHDLAQE
ncbi:uncharacterized protein LOC120278572 [Dioscorea cayenensis subsp. rotundata]|uniref:Uncharacterized protein LOC120278572 n=1 Tax=Dioscorea cayennensis subsp. rotundata TaxID=55577 RepID=A0AB40CR40_DIOCR|nr:uncharacterized protein LOC120278572 [Dioscorea cayenensis subsp. rotundata]